MPDMPFITRPRYVHTFTCRKLSVSDMAFTDIRPRHIYNFSYKYYNSDNIINISTALTCTYFHVYETVIVWHMAKFVRQLWYIGSFTYKRLSLSDMLLLWRHVRYVHTFTYRILWVFDRWRWSCYGLDRVTCNWRAVSDRWNKSSGILDTNAHARTHKHTLTATHKHRLCAFNFAPYAKWKISY